MSPNASAVRLIYMRYPYLLILLAFASAAFAQSFQSSLLLGSYSLDFGAVLTGTPSGWQTLTVFNNGMSPQELSGISITGDFAETNNCPQSLATLAANAHCEIQITFKPSSAGLRSGKLTVSVAPGDNQLAAALSGTGTAEKPTVTVSPRSLVFAEQKTGASRPPQTLTVTNTGAEMVSVTNVEANEDFLVSPASTCVHRTAPLSPKATCAVEIVFTPLLSGQRSGEAVILDTAEDSPEQVPLSGLDNEPPPLNGYKLREI
jgi:hypothetical protein